MLIAYTVRDASGVGGAPLCPSWPVPRVRARAVSWPDARAGATLARRRRVARMAQLHRGPGAARRAAQPRAVRSPRSRPRRLRDPRAALRAAGAPDADESARRGGRGVEVAAVPPGVAARDRRSGAPRAVPLRRPGRVR